jgi:hypothetical protein
MTSQDRANHLLSLDQQARRMKLSDAAREEILAGADWSEPRPTANMNTNCSSGHNPEQRAA